MAVLVAGGLTCFMLFLGLVIDVGFWYVRKAQVQLNADLAVLSAMGMMDQSQPAHAQATFVRNTTLGILASNGYNISQWQVNTTTETVGARTIVSTAVVDTVQQLPRFFTAVVGAGTVPMYLLSKAEKKVLPPIEYSCSIIALGDVTLNGGGNGQIDSFIDNRVVEGSLDGKSYDNKAANFCANGDFKLGGNSGIFGTITSGGTITKNGVGSYVASGNWTLGGTTGNVPTEGSVTQKATVPTFTWNLPAPPLDLNTTGNNNGSIGGTCGRPDASGDWSCAGNKTALVPVGGTYYVRNLRFTGQANIQLTGTPGATPTDFWVTGDMDIAGGVSFQAATSGGASGVGSLGGVKAGDLRIIGLGTEDADSNHQIAIRGGSEIIADIMAPTYDLAIGGSSTSFFGRMVGNDIIVDGGVTFSYDESIPATKYQAPGPSIRVHLIE